MVYQEHVFAALLFVHLVCFAAYLAAGFAQQQIMKRSTALAAAIRDDQEKLAASIVTKIELPAIMGSIISGIGFVSMTPELMKQGWLHGKLLCVLILLVLSHLEMFNARRIVRARDANKTDEIDARKKRHALLGLVGTLAAIGLLISVTFVRLGGH
jgi:uncharacterized membrane protein